MSWMRLPESRWSAFAGHVLISVAIFLALFALIYFLLFPGALFPLAGGVDGIKIVAGVDVVLGPLLTLVIYNIAKPPKELIRDLSVIGLVQIGALAAGMWIVYSSRPVAATFIYDRFHATKASEFERVGNPQPAGTNLLTPAFYYTTLSDDPTEALKFMAETEFSETPPRTRSALMRPLPTEQAPLAKVFRYLERAGDELSGDCLQVELVTAFDTGTVCFDAEKRRFRRVAP